MLDYLKFKGVLLMALVLCGSIGDSMEGSQASTFSLSRSGSSAHGDNDWVSHDSGRDEDMLKRIVSDAMSKVKKELNSSICYL